MSSASDINFHKNNFILVIDSVKSRCSKKSSKKNYSVVKIADDFSRICDDINICINWGFFLGHSVPENVKQKMFEKNTQLNIDNIFGSMNCIKKDWNADIKSFFTSLDEYDIVNIVQYSETICAASDGQLFEIFFVSNSDLCTLFEKQLSLGDEINEIKNQNNLQLTKIESVVNDFKKDNNYLVNILQDIEEENQSLNERISQLQRENSFLREKIFQSEEALVQQSQIQSSHEKESIILKSNAALKKEIYLLEATNRDLLNENEKLYEQITNKRGYFGFC
jgi:hypothetical protein